jgi:4-amino-4-deoxy-L-arabinose transferase-like glycosyltransferase
VERLASLAMVGVTAGLFLLYLAIAPAVNPTFDDAKYVAVGRNVLAGNGPFTLFGVVFLKHSPLWPLMVTIPEQLPGVDAIDVGQFLNAISGAASIALIAYLGWRVRPFVGAVSAVVYGSLAYVFDVERTAGIDLPSIALTLLYLAIGFRAIRTGSSGLALVMG